jgi:hypothetical protein
VSPFLPEDKGRFILQNTDFLRLFKELSTDAG